MLCEPKTKNFLDPKFKRDESNISSEENLANIHRKSDGESRHCGGNDPAQRNALAMPKVQATNGLQIPRGKSIQDS
jgi:hypothetical protein